LNIVLINFIPYRPKRSWRIGKRLQYFYPHLFWIYPEFVSGLTCTPTRYPSTFQRFHVHTFHQAEIWGCKGREIHGILCKYWYNVC